LADARGPTRDRLPFRGRTEPVRANPSLSEEGGRSTGGRKSDDWGNVEKAGRFPGEEAHDIEPDGRRRRRGINGAQRHEGLALAAVDDIVMDPLLGEVQADAQLGHAENEEETKSPAE